jgi:2,3-bisphosphoglycerate-dependent phosphoglycerate mutase
MSIFVIVRHGQSQWNLENRFTGEVDVPLTEIGIAEAHEAGKKLKGYRFAEAFTSQLTRAQETLQIILEEIDQPSITVIKDKRFNERNYGQLQGLDKAETAKKYGEGQVEIWRRSYEVAPPGGESLADTAARVIPCYKNRICPLLATGENILLVAHGNSLRALMMQLENISVDKIPDINIPTGVPRIYELGKNLEMLSVRYL